MELMWGNTKLTCRSGRDLNILFKEFVKMYKKNTEIAKENKNMIEVIEGVNMMGGGMFYNLEGDSRGQFGEGQMCKTEDKLGLVKSGYEDAMMMREFFWQLINQRKASAERVLQRYMEKCCQFHDIVEEKGDEQGLIDASNKSMINYNTNKNIITYLTNRRWWNVKMNGVKLRDNTKFKEILV